MAIGVDKMISWTKAAQIGVGLYLVLPGAEDVATGGIALAPSALLGAALVADGFGVKVPILSSALR
jgi:hypothetical protein